MSSYYDLEMYMTNIFKNLNSLQFNQCLVLKDSTCSVSLFLYIYNCSDSYYSVPPIPGKSRQTPEERISFVTLRIHNPFTFLVPADLV